jgi:hypothetical protein
MRSRFLAAIAAAFAATAITIHSGGPPRAILLPRLSEFHSDEDELEIDRYGMELEIDRRFEARSTADSLVVRILTPR